MKSCHPFLIKAVILICLLVSFRSVAQPNRLIADQSPDGTNFWAYTPDGWLNNGAPWAMLVCLHGGSGLVDNNDMNVIVTNSPEDGTHLTPPRLIYNSLWDHSRPFVIIAPHLKRDPTVALNSQEWPPELIDEVVEYAIGEYNIDPNKIYVTGISLGAAGTWKYAAAYPEKVAAIVPISGKTPIAEACTFKNIPVWAFHGSNDDQVYPSWSEDIVRNINLCNSKLYTPKLNLLHSMAHEGWNMVYDKSHQYDIYSWMSKFIKNSHSNHAPYVTVGVDRKLVVRTGPLYISSEYFDSDGDGAISNVVWSKVSGPAITMEDVTTGTLRLPDPVAGTFVFRLTVTDPDGGVSYDDIQIQFLASNSSPAVTALELTSGNGSTLYSALADDATINMFTLGLTAFNIRAVTSGTTSAVRFSINGDQSTRTHVAGSGPYYVKQTAPSPKVWTIAAGTYQICATPFNASTEGTSRCYKVTFTDEPASITKYYSVAGSNIASLSSWKSARDGSGLSPASFSDPNQWFYVQNNVNLSGALTIGELSSRLTIESGAELYATAALSANLYVMDGATMRINTASSISAPLFVGASSNYILEDAVVTVAPFNATVPYGNLVLTSSVPGNVKSLTSSTNTNTFVKGDFTISPNVKLQRGATSSDIVVRGNVYLNGPSENTNCFSLRFNGYGVQNLNLPGGTFSFRNFVLETDLGGGTVVKVVSPMPSVVRIATGTSVGIQLKAKSVLILNGHTLSLEGGPINGANLTGQINAENSALVINSTSSANLPIYLRTVPGNNRIKSLEINATGNGTGLHIVDPLYVTERLRITGGTITTNSNLTLVSTPTSTAYIAPVSGGPTISGNINVERSVPAGDYYRYLSFPVTGATIGQLNQHIPPVPVIYYYDEGAGGWVEQPTTNQGTSLVIGRGYSFDINSPTNPEHVTVSGEVHTGDFSFNALLSPNTTSAANKGWTLLGNPYASPIKWAAPAPGSATWDGTNINSTVYVRVQDNGTDRFRFHDGQIGNFSGDISSGQSFWIRTTTPTPSLTITETAKLEATNVQLYRTGSSDAVYLHFRLNHNDLDDDAFIKFNPDGKLKFDTQRDAVKKKNDFFNLSLLSSDSVGTAIKNLSDTLCSQEIALAVEPQGPGMYSFSVEGSAFDVISSLSIADNYTNKVTDLKEGKEYTFEVTNAPESYHPKRFTLLIDNNRLPRPAISFSNGSLMSSVSTNVQWFLDGVEIAGATQPEYVPVAEGNYSVRTTYKGCSKESAAYSFRITGTNPLASEITVYPNPANDRLTIRGLHRVSDAVAYQITSLTGAAVQSGEVDYDRANGEGTIHLGSLAPGLYILDVRGGANLFQFKISVR